jgi:L-glyceraldehyde reductase
MSLRKSIQLNNGTSIPQIGLGTWLSKPHEVEQAVSRRVCVYAIGSLTPAGTQVVWAVEVGYRHIDCAYVYGNQEEARPMISSRRIFCLLFLMI